MTPIKTVPSPVHSAPRGVGLLVSALTLASLVACGGSGDSSSSSGPTSTLTNASVAVTRYGASALITLNGTALDSSGLSVTSAGCKNMTRLTSGSTVSTATTAYYGCVVSGAYTSTVTIQSNGTTLGNPSFTVASPQVTLAVSNTLGVNGNIVIDLYGDRAALTVDNFLGYVNSGFYNGLIFHRLSPNFVLQGGGYTPTTTGVLPAPKATTQPPVAYETGGGKNLQWTVAMARTQALNSATSQFFVNLVDNPVLDAATAPYAVFGNLTTASEDVVTSITRAPCVIDTVDLPATDCLPSPNVVITSATQTQ